MAGEDRKRTLRGPMLAAWLGMQVGKRLGLGVPLLRLAFSRMFSEEGRRRAFAGYRPDGHDVFVATFGKSGTNWMMQIALQIAYRGEAEFDHIHDLVAWPDSPAPGVVALSDPAPREASPTGLRVIKTHLEPAYVPYDERATYLTVIRDPKEVLVSSYYFLGGIFGVLSHVTIADWLDLFMQPGGLAEGWAAHTAGFWEWRTRPNVLVIGYGDLKREPRRQIGEVARRMGVTLDDAQRARVEERSGFDWMRANESRFAPPRSPFAKPEDATRMIRSGRVGASGELLGPAEQREVDARCQQELQRLGSDFPYRALFAADAVQPPARHG